MKILHTVESYFPAVGGMAEVVRQLSERIVKMGHHVTVACGKYKTNTLSCNKNGVEIMYFGITGNMVKGITEEKDGEIDRYLSLVNSGKFDLVVNFAAQQWATDLLLPNLNKLSCKKVFVPTGFSALFNPKFYNYFESMKEWLKFYDMNIFLSENYRDINFAKKFKISKYEIIPNGASPEEFQFFEENKIEDFKARYQIHGDGYLILHVGSHTGMKGHKEAIQIFSQANIKKTTLMIIGNEVHWRGNCNKYCKESSEKINSSKRFKENENRIIICDLTREETVNAYKAADLFLFPSNIECSPLVLFEAMASSTPFLTTDVGNSKEIINWSNAGIILPTRFVKEMDISSYVKMTLHKLYGNPFKTHNMTFKKGPDNSFSKAHIKKSAKLLQQVLTDKNLRTTLGNMGRSAWEKHFKWDIITQKYMNIYKNLLNG